MISFPKSQYNLKFIFIVILGAILVSFPALYNGYPLVNSDDGTYISSGFKFEQPGDRPITYGLFLRVFSLDGFSLWLPLAVQALIVSWLVVKVLQRTTDEKSFFRRAIITLVMLTLTSLSWTASEIIPDIWTGISMLALVLIVLNRERPFVRIFLYLLFFCAVATHMSNIMIFTLVILCIALFRKWLFDSAVRRAALIRLVLLLLVTWSTLAVMGGVSARSKHVFLMASMLEKGVLKSYLDDQCDRKQYGICAYKDNMTSDPNAFIWDQSSPLYRQGGWDSTRKEYNAITADIITNPAYLSLFAKASLEASFRQLFECHNAEGNFPFPQGTHVDAAVKQYIPHDTTAYRSAWQHQHNIVERIDAMNNIYYIIVLAGVIILVLLSRQLKIATPAGLVIVLMVVTYLVNIVDCATFAQVNARYGSRMMWVLPFAAWIGLCAPGMQHSLRNIRSEGFRLPVRLQKLFARIAVVVVIAGVFLRLVEWWHARDLMMDEINVVRNIFERDFGGLLRPLAYQQFAPPLFLWILKLEGLVTGYGEMSMRFFPVMCSCLALVLFYFLLKRNGQGNTAWYPLALFAFAQIYIQYGNDVKQYASDSLVTVLLLLVASATDFQTDKRSHFFLRWLLLGALSIWLSMPAVFLLAGVGCFLLVKAMRERQKQFYGVIAATGLSWLCFFFVYFRLLLQDQLTSEYLHLFHAPFFLNYEKLRDISDAHNNSLLANVFADSIGSSVQIAVVWNFVLVLAGLVTLLFSKTKKGLLFLLPLFGLLAAAVFHYFTLLPRVCIFILPLILFIIGCGLRQAMSFSSFTACAALACSITAVLYAQSFSVLYRRMEADELTTSVNFARRHQVPYANIYLPVLYEPSYIYYTEIHPDKKRAQQYRQIRRLYPDQHYAQLVTTLKGRVAFIYFWIDDAAMATHRDSIFRYLKPVDELVRPGYKALVFER